MAKLGRNVLNRVRKTTARSLCRPTRSSEGCVRKRRGIGMDWDSEVLPPASKILQRDAIHSAREQSREPNYRSMDHGELDEERFKASLHDERDKYVKEKGNWKEDDDDDDVCQEFVKQRLLQTYSNAEVRLTAEALIEEDWLSNVEALPGNIYRIAVMGAFFDKASRRHSCHDNIQIYAKMWGLFIIVIIQTVGPPMIFLSRMLGFGVPQVQHYNWECCPWYRFLHLELALDDASCGIDGTHPLDVSMFDDWAHIKTTKALGMLMMTAFILNGLFVLLDERKSWMQIYNTFRYLDVQNSNFRFKGISFLYVDACINCWVISWCCLDVFLVIGASQSPSEVLMNALALMFLYNLDDIGGDFGFVDEDDWPGARMAWIYKMIVSPSPHDVFDETILDWRGWFALSVYNASFGVLTLYLFGLPLLAAITPFIQIV